MFRPVLLRPMAVSLRTRASRTYATAGTYPGGPVGPEAKNNNALLIGLGVLGAGGAYYYFTKEDPNARAARGSVRGAVNEAEGAAKGAYREAEGNVKGTLEHAKGAAKGAFDKTKGAAEELESGAKRAVDKVTK